MNGYTGGSMNLSTKHPNIASQKIFLRKGTQKHVKGPNKAQKCK